MQRRLRRDSGTVTTEMVLISPVLLAFFCLAILVGRLADAKSDVIGAANDAARVASLQLSEGAARTQGQLAAEDTLAGEGINCVDGVQVNMDFPPSGFPSDPAARADAMVHVHVECTVAAGDLAFIGVPTNITIDQDAWEPIDEHRSQGE